MRCRQGPCSRADGKQGLWPGRAGCLCRRGCAQELEGPGPASQSQAPPVPGGYGSLPPAQCPEGQRSVPGPGSSNELGTTEEVCLDARNGRQGSPALLKALPGHAGPLLGALTTEAAGLGAAGLRAEGRRGAPCPADTQRSLLWKHRGVTPKKQQDSTRASTCPACRTLRTVPSSRARPEQEGPAACTCLTRQHRHPPQECWVP